MRRLLLRAQGGPRSTDSAPGPLGRPTTGRVRALRRHAPYLAALLGVVLLLTRRFFSPGIPAGADAFGLMSRSAVSARSGLLSTWSPIGFGSPRTFALDQLLVIANTVTRNSVTTYKLMVVSILLAAGCFTYLLAWQWFRSRPAAALAGALYVLSPLPISQFTTGHLNITIVIALLPLQLFLWDRALRRFDLRTAIALGLTFGALLLVRPDMVVISATTSGLFFVAMLLTGGGRKLWASALLTTAVAACCALLLDAAQIVPALAGARASWASGQALFDSQQLIDHSLPALQSLVGLSQETGYLGYMNLPFAYGHPWLSYSLYIALALAPFGLAVGLVGWCRDVRVTALLFVGLCATFLSKGIRGPVGGVYAFAIDSVHPLTNFRNPTRWNVIQALVFSMLAARAIQLGSRAFAAAWSRRAFGRQAFAPRWKGAALAGALAAILTGLVLLPAMPTVAHGLATYRLSPSQAQLLGTIKRDRGEFITATAPYGATYRFVESNDYRGYEQDLGTDSSMFTGHPAIGDGSWGGRGQAFITFSHALLRRRDPAFVSLLAANNVKYMASLNYPALAPNYTTSASGDPNLAAQPFADQRALGAMPSLASVTSNRAGTVFAVPSPSRVISASSNLATVFGGYSALAEMADTPGIDLRDWAGITAGDALDSGGLKQLHDLVDRSQLVYVGDTRINDVALAALDPTARLPGIFSRTSGTQPENALAEAGQLVTRSDDDSSLRPSSSSVTAPVSGAIELWVRAQSSPVPGRIVATVDGRAAGSLLPLSTTSTGFHWTRIWSGSPSAGTHTFRISSAASDVGLYANVTQAVLVRPAARSAAESKVRAMLATAAARTIYASDPSIAENTIPETALSRGAITLPSSSAEPFWSLVDPGSSKQISTVGPDREVATAVHSTSRRRYFAVAQHLFKTPQDWSSSEYFLVRFYGAGNGDRYEVNAFDSKLGRAPYTFVDDHAGWRTLAFSIPHPTSGASSPPLAASGFDWSRITVLKLSTPTKRSALAIQLGSVSLTRPAPAVSMRLDVVPSIASALPAVLPGSSSPCPPAALSRPRSGAGIYDVTVPTGFADLHCRVVIGPKHPLSVVSPPAIRVRKTGQTSYAIKISTANPAVLRFARSYDGGWKLSGSRQLASSNHLPTLGLPNGYVLNAGNYALRLEYGPDRAVLPGLLVSTFVLAAALLALVALSLRRSSISVRAGALFTGRPRHLRAHGSGRATGWPVVIALAVAGCVAMLLGSTRYGVWALLSAGLIAPIGWRVYWTLALAAGAAAVLFTVRGNAHAADVMAVAAVLTALRTTVTLLLSQRPASPSADPTPTEVTAADPGEGTSLKDEVVSI